MLDALVTVDLFKALPVDALERLIQRGQRRTFPAGVSLMRQGEPSDAMYVIERGRVRVERTHPQLTETILLAELGPGEVVGEMGVLDGDPRSASVTAIDDTEAIELGPQALYATLTEFPELANALLRVLSRRLRSTDELTEAMLLRSHPELVEGSKKPGPDAPASQ